MKPKPKRITVIGGGPGGLYAALLIKRAWPQDEVVVYERNRPDDTFGFGVVFSDETLGIFRDADRPSYEAIRRSFAYWDDVEIHYRGERFRVSGNGFAGCSRRQLLSLLQTRCEALGVELHFEREVAPEALAALELESDLVIAADGINSRVREHDREHFGTEVTLGKNYFSWMGSSRELDAFKYFFRLTDHGPVVAHCYQYAPKRSTWVIEMPPETWEGFGFAALSEAGAARLLEDVFAAELAGHPLLVNRSIWRRFPTVTNARWVKGNTVLLGDAKASAHYSIGSGTKLAMEDAIHLFKALHASPEAIPAALQHFERTRRDEVGKTQHAATVSAQWFEGLSRHYRLAPEQFAFGVMSRSKQITLDNLRLRDEAFARRIEAWFLAEVRRQGFAVAPETPAMFTPFKLRGMRLENRVVLSPMAQYMAEDGVPNEWHYVHLCSRAVGGAGLVYTEMTCPAPDARITPGCTGLWNEAQRDAFGRIVAFIHRYSRAKVCLQLGHAGRKGSTQLGWEEMDKPLPAGNWPIYSASPLPYFEGISQVPRELSKADMARITAEFVRAARLGDEAGFDMLELHMAHGYLLASFISPLTNRRQDEYGGSIENRLRFPLELFGAVRAVWPAEKPMAVRISASDWAPGGLSEDDLVTLAWRFKEAGVDLIDVSTGQTVPDQKPVYGRMYQTPFAELVRQEVGIATMAVGNITTADQVNTVLLQGRSDLVALARPHLYTPYFTLQAAATYDYQGQYWPNPYLSGKAQAHRLLARQREEFEEMRRALKPPSHQLKPDEDEVQRCEEQGDVTRA